MMLPTGTNSGCAGCPSYGCNYFGVYYIDDLSIIAVPPTLSASNVTVTNCAQTTVTLTATGSSSVYTSWTDGTNTYTGSTIIVPAPTFPTTYTCSVSLPGVSTCGMDQTITIYNSCAPCSTPTNVLATSLTNQTLTSTFYAMNNNLTINGNCTFNQCEIQIIRTASITVTPGSTLNILGSHLYACGDMWQGIVVQAGGVLNLNTSGAKCSFIEDAVVAVDIQAGSALTTNILTSITTSYNKNKTNIKIAGYTPTITPYPFTIYGNMFTSRTITFTPGSIIWPHCNTVKAATNPTTSPLQSPYINDATYIPANLKAPYSSAKPDYGILLDGVGATLNPSTTPTYYEIQIGIGSGTNTYNIFDNLYYGIYSLDANIYCINNIFQKGQTFGRGGASGGYGIHEVINSEGAFRRLKLTGATSTTYINKFFDCTRSINTNAVFEHIITDCDFRSTATSYTLPTLPLNPTGDMGVNIVTSRYRAINVSGNHLYNITNGILFTADIGNFDFGAGNSQGRYGGQVDINSNEIRAHLPAQTITNQFVNVAISANDVMTTTSGYSVFTIASTSICANTNTINDVWNGISQTNFGQQPATVWSNTITMVNQPTSAPPLAQFGVQNNQLATGFIYKNTINGPATYSNVMKAITTSMNSTLTVKCNTTSQTQRGIEFNSTQANTVFWDNTMSSHTNGLALDNSGVIGTQGSTTIPTDNQWTGTWTIPNYKTFTYGVASSATNSPMYIRYATGNYDPQGSGNTTAFLGVDEYHHTGSNDNLFNITGSPSARTCPSTPTCPTCRGFSHEESIASNEPLLEQLAYGKILYKKTSPELEYMNQLYVYRQLMSKPKARNQSVGNSSLNQFYNTAARTNIGALDDIEVDLLNADYTLAKAKIATLTPANAVEANYKNYYTAYVNSKEGNFSSTDSTNITSLANGCPFTDGGVVYQARALYNVAFDTYRLFYDICNTDENNERLVSDSEQKNISAVHFSHIYPNPTNGLVNVQVSNGKDKEEVSVDVLDITGKLVYSTKQVLNNKTAVLHPDLSNGTYLVKVKLNDGTTDIHRLVISK